MVKVKVLIVCVCCVLALSGCGFSTTIMTNNAATLTNVELTKKNFTVLGRVEGEASSTYVLGFGGLSNALYTRAFDNMMKKVKLQGKARAVVNVMYDTGFNSYVLFSTRKVRAIGYVIEFTE